MKHIDLPKRLQIICRRTNPAMSASFSVEIRLVVVIRSALVHIGLSQEARG